MSCKHKNEDVFVWTCDEPGCSREIILDGCFIEPRTEAAIYGWISRDRKQFCPDHATARNLWESSLYRRHCDTVIPGPRAGTDDGE